MESLNTKKGSRQNGSSRILQWPLSLMRCHYQQTAHTTQNVHTIGCWTALSKAKARYKWVKKTKNTLPARLQEICLGLCYDRIYTIIHCPGDRALAPCPVPAISTTSQVAFQTFWIKAAGPAQGFQPNRKLQRAISRKSLPTEQDGSLS